MVINEMQVWDAFNVRMVVYMICMVRLAGSMVLMIRVRITSTIPHGVHFIRMSQVLEHHTRKRVKPVFDASMEVCTITQLCRVI